MSVQHEYRGFGDPNGNIIAEVNSHYLNESDSSSWICVSNTGTAAEWRRLAGPVLYKSAGTYAINGLQHFEGVVEANTQFTFSLPDRILSNVVIGGNPAGFVTESPARVEIRPITEGAGLMVCVTLLTEY